MSSNSTTVTNTLRTPQISPLQQSAPSMSFGVAVALLTSVVLVGCSPEPLKVRITPNLYEVGDVKSALATPAVDEVVRLKPKHALILACRSTKPPKIIQFERELRARHEVELKLMLITEGCPSA